jgi:mRNA interferase MazF
MKRGTLVWVDLSDTFPPEMGKIRPAVIVSGDVHNAVLETVVVVPTSSLAPEILPLRVHLGTFAGTSSFAVIPGIRQVSKRRIRQIIGHLSADRLAVLEQSLRHYLN